MSDAVVRATRKWIESVVIDLELCPFAAPVLAAGRVEIACSEASDADALLADLDAELARLLRTPIEEIETTLLVHPHALDDFDAYNAFLDVADALLDERGCTGVIQIASFHPDYRFADDPEAPAAPGEDAANWTNRSPFPMLHLLREASVEAAIASFGDTASIPARNAARLRELGVAAVRERLAACRDEVEARAARKPTKAR